MDAFIRIVVVAAVIALPGAGMAGERFDGKWDTTLTCPDKGKTLGYTWHFVSTISDGVLHGERGAAGQPGSFSLDGKIGDDGAAKLTGNGIVMNREYARGVFAAKGEEYSYSVKVQFKETAGSGVRDEGLGIVGRPCTVHFVKQSGVGQAVGGP
jgi:hypothetical protein